MTLRSCLLFARSLVFPRKSLDSTARKSVKGAIFCAGLSLIPLIVVLSISEGMISGITERIIGLSSGHLQTYLRKTSVEVSSLDNLEEFAAELSKVEGVTAVFPEIECDALAAGKKYRTGARIRAVDADIFTENRDFARLFTVEDGDTKNFAAGKKNAVIGSKLAELLSLKAGDVFRVITTSGAGSGRVTPKASVFKVGAIVSSGYQELDALWCFIPIDAGFKFIPVQSAAYSVMIFTENPFNASLETIKKNCNEVSIGAGVTFDWKELNESQFENFSSTKVLLMFVMAMIVAVAAVNISSALIMLVMERRKEIAILKSLGGTGKGISLSFIFAGTFCGFAGSLIGLPLGIILSLNVNHVIRFMENVVNLFARVMFFFRGGNLSNFVSVTLLDPAFYLTSFTVSIPWGKIFIIWVITILLSVIASLVPAINAGKEKPLDIFRKS